MHALRQQVKADRMHAIFGGKNPHVQSLRVGGVTCREEGNAGRISEFRTILDDMIRFIDTIYLPDVRHLSRVYPEWAKLGGFGNYLAFGEFQMSGTDPDALFFPCGVITDRDLGNVQDVLLAQISEHVRHSWYDGTTPRYPQEGETLPNYTGYDTADRYSWLKAPRYNGVPMEVGPQARILVGYGVGQSAIVSAVNSFLSETGLNMDDLHSTIGRSAARAIETKIIADEMVSWLSQLQPGWETRVNSAMAAQASGIGLNEAPRGALGHWINIEGGKIGNYQMVVPSTWNLGPRCASGARGPVEQALIGTPVEDPARPVEILRIVHSYDPCMACAVHVTDNDQQSHFAVQAV